MSRMTIVIEGDDRVRDQMVGQMGKLVDVLAVSALTGGTVGRELALIKVRADRLTRSAILQIADVFRGQVVDVTRDAVMIEITGDEAKVGALLDVLGDYGVLEVARTGVVALSRGAEVIAVTESPPVEDGAQGAPDLPQAEGA